MTQLTLRPMTSDELDSYLDRMPNGYAQQRMEFGGEDRETAERYAAEALEQFFPDRRPASGHHLYVAEVDGERVGSLWLAEQLGRGPAGQGWVYDIQIDPKYRGRGYGRALMEAAEDAARGLGCTSLALNVFGGNEVAISLYESMGYLTRSRQMNKQL